jgi:hypothetical protein
MIRAREALSLCSIVLILIWSSEICMREIFPGLKGAKITAAPGLYMIIAGVTNCSIQMRYETEQRLLPFLLSAFL